MPMTPLQQSMSTSWCTRSIPTSKSAAKRSMLRHGLTTLYYRRIGPPSPSIGSFVILSPIRTCARRRPNPALRLSETVCASERHRSLLHRQKRPTFSNRLVDPVAQVHRQVFPLGAKKPNLMSMMKLMMGATIHSQSPHLVSHHHRIPSPSGNPIPRADRSRSLLRKCLDRKSGNARFSCTGKRKERIL